MVIPDRLPFRFFSFFFDVLSAPVLAPSDDPGSTDAAEYGGGFSLPRCAEAAIARSESASAALLVGGDVFDRSIWRVGDMARKGEIMSAASVRGCAMFCPCEEKPDEIGETSNDVAAILVAERTDGVMRGEMGPGDPDVFQNVEGCTGFRLRIEGPSIVTGW